MKQTRNRPTPSERALLHSAPLYLACSLWYHYVDIRIELQNTEFGGSSRCLPSIAGSA